MVREEIPYAFGFAGECMMCKVPIGPQESRVAVYEVQPGRKKEYIGILCPTCAKINREPAEKPKAVPGEGIISDIEMIVRIYDLGGKYAKAHKIDIRPEDLMKAAITTFIESRRR
jgi:hypothetical protein